MEKPGWKTTEFWLSVVAMVVGAIMASGAISNESVIQALGVVAAILGQLGYSVPRSMAKGAAERAKIAPPPGG